MSYSPTLFKTFKKGVLNTRSIIFITFFSLLYFSSSILLLNFKLLSSPLFQNSDISFKLNLTFQLIIGSYSALSLIDFLLLIVSSILVGINILFISKLLIALKNPGVKLGITVGGSTILGIFVVGCSSCGFSILSLIGIAGALAFIPFGGIGLHLISISLLLFSVWYSAHNYHNKIVCKIN